MRTSTEQRAPARAARRVPDFFIVGQPKSGTTALYQMLRRHPQIFMPAVKEPRYLATDLRALVPSTPRQPETLAGYLALFASAGPRQLVGEASPMYLRSREAARAIAELQPAARIVAIFREPVSFVRSLHLQLLQEHVERERDFAKAIAKEALERGGERRLRYSDFVHYTEQLRRFHDAFPREQVLTLIYEDFRADNEGTLRRVLRFLGADENAQLELLEANPSVALRAPRADAALRSLTAGRGVLARTVRAGTGAVLPRGLRQRALGALRRRWLYGEPEPVAAELALALKRRYKPEVLAFGDYIGRDLIALWGYEQVD